jgi:hypothetical protein
LIHRNEPNRPHISSDIINVKKHKPQTKTNQPRHKQPARLPVNASDFYRTFHVAASRPSRRSVAAASVRGCLRPVFGGRKGFFRSNAIFLFFPKNRVFLGC